MPFSKKAKYIHKEILDIKDFDDRSIRTILLGKSGKKARIGCPKSKWSPSKKKCKVGTKIITILTPKKRTPKKRTKSKSKRR